MLQSTGDLCSINLLSVAHVAVYGRPNFESGLNGYKYNCYIINTKKITQPIDQIINSNTSNCFVFSKI